MGEGSSASLARRRMLLSHGEDSSMQVAQSKMRVSELLKQHNNQKANEINVQKFAKAREYKAFTIPKAVENRVPRHWLTFMEEALNELTQVTNHIYEGAISKGVKSGAGQVIFPNGDIYKGQWKSDVRHGAGLCKFGATGAIYKGEWRDGSPQGNGLLFTLPCEVIEGRFDGYKLLDGQVKILF